MFDAHEIWKEIPGWEGIYMVSSQGRVRSFDKRVRCGYGRTRIYPGRILSPGLKDGYPIVGLHHEGKQTMAQVHRLVCLAFHGPAPSPAHEVAHADGNPGNPHYLNLRWATHAENEADKLGHGTKVSGEAHGMVKLTAEQVREIRNSSERQCDLAERFGVNRSTICLIKKGKLWRELESV